MGMPERELKAWNLISSRPTDAFSGQNEQPPPFRDSSYADNPFQTWLSAAGPASELWKGCTSAAVCSSPSVGFIGPHEQKTRHHGYLCVGAAILTDKD